MDHNFDCDFQYEYNNYPKDETYQNLDLNGLIDEEEYSKKDYDPLLSDSKKNETESDFEEDFGQYFKFGELQNEVEMDMDETRPGREMDCSEWDVLMDYSNPDEMNMTYDCMDGLYEDGMSYSNQDELEVIYSSQDIPTTHIELVEDQSPMDQMNYSNPEPVLDMCYNIYKDVISYDVAYDKYSIPTSQYEPILAQLLRSRKSSNLNVPKVIRTVRDAIKRAKKPQKPLIHRLSSIDQLDPHGYISSRKRIKRRKNIILSPDIGKWAHQKNGYSTLDGKLLRPPFTYTQLAKFAIRNSPNGWISVPDIYNFVLHHFPFYRFTNIQWQSSMRQVLSQKKNFVSRKVDGEKRFEYSLVDPTGNVNYLYGVRQFMTNERGEDFYTRMTNGEFGLPRRLFYHVVGRSAPMLSGPENSALFYHLISIGHIPEPQSTFYQIYMKSSQLEPKFEEVFENFKNPVKLDDISGFGVNSKDGSEWNNMKNDQFHLKINDYFELQKACKLNGVENWTTPSLVQKYNFD